MKSLLRSVLAGVLVASLALLLGACSPEAKKQKTQASADRLYEAGEYDRAEVEYLNLLKLEPTSGWAIGRLGLIYTAQGRTSRAIAHIMRGHEMLPNDLDLRLKVGQLYFASGKLPEARSEANFVLDRKPLDPEAPSLLVATLAKPEEADALRQRLLALPAPAPTGAPVLTALAALELRLGKVAEAEALLQKAKAADANYAALYSMQAAVQLAKKNLPEADAAFKQAATLSPPRSPRYIQYAQFKVRSGDLASGIKLLEEITVKTPDYVPAWIALADIHLSQNKPAESEPFLAKALARDPQNLEALVLQGRIHNLRNEFDKAIALFEKLATAYPRVPLVHQELGRAYAGTGDITKAIASLNQAQALAPNAPETVMLLARLMSRKGDHAAAIALLRKTVEQRPDIPQARLILADAYRNQGNLDAALAIYRELEQQVRDNPQIPMLTGLVLSQQGKNDEARAAFERTFVLTPDSPVALEQLVNLDLREKKFGPALARIEAEVAKNKKLEGFGQLLQAKVFLAQNDRTSAEGRLKRAIELMPDAPTAYFLLAGIYSRTNQQDKALTQLNEVLTRDPKQATALMLVSVINDQRGNHTAARDGYEKLLAINPRSVVALNNLAYLYAEKLNDLEKAHELAQKARQLAPNDPHNADTLGWILHRKRQYTWALSLLQEAAEKMPGEAEAHYHLGLTHYMMGDEVPARSSLERALELDGNATWAPTARSAVTLIGIDPATITPAAKGAIDQALQERPEDPVALTRLAALQERDGKTDDAIASLESALKANAHNANLLINLARLHGAAKNSAKALEYAKAARKQSPDDPSVAQSLGRLAYQNGDYPWSASLLQEAARKLESPDLLFDLALATYATGRTGEAETALRGALALAERQPLPVFSRAKEAREMLALLGLADNPAEAAQQAALIERAAKQDPASVPGLMAAATLSEQRLNVDAARQAYTKVLTLLPDFLPAKRRLVVLGASLTEFDQKVYDWALQVRPAYLSDALVAKTLGIQTLLKGDPARALTLLKESAAARESDADLYYYYGVAQHRQKDAGFAKTLQRALDLGLKDKTAVEEARKLLAPPK